MLVAFRRRRLLSAPDITSFVSINYIHHIYTVNTMIYHAIWKLYSVAKQTKFSKTVCIFVLANLKHVGSNVLQVASLSQAIHAPVCEPGPKYNCDKRASNITLSYGVHVDK